jgi:transposase
VTATKQTVVEVSLHEIEKLLERAKREPLNEEQCALIRDLAVSYLHLTDMVKDRETSLAQLRKALFGSTSEKTKTVLEQIAQDGTAQAPADTSPEASDSPPTPPQRRKGHGRNGAGTYGGAKRVPVTHPTIKAGDCCPDCKKGRVRGLEPERLIRVTGQAPLAASVFEQQRLRCMTCGTTFKAPVPPGIGEKKYDAKSASMIGLLRYGSGLPHNRMQRLQGDFGIPLPASTQYEIVAAAAASLRPAYEEMARQAAGGQVIHNDDTKALVLQVLRDRAAAEQPIDEVADRKDDDQRTGMFTTSIVSQLEEHRIALFFTGRQHAGENLADVLRRRTSELGPPIQMCDGLDRNLPKGLATVISNCLAHGRRKFVDVAESFPAECLHVLESLRQVYHNDDLAKQQRLSSAQRLLLHQESSQPVMDELKTWLRAEIEERRVEPNSSLGTAIAYMLKRWPQLTLFLRVAGAPLDNNICERALKMAIMHRKNSLFYKTENGARVGDLYMTLIHTARLCGANAFEYLTALQENAAAVGANPSAWMPWNYANSLPPVSASP